MAPLERACFELAKKAHEGQTRNKPIDPRPPYITHPVIAYKLGKAIGISDMITLGAVLDHDCLEQGVIDGKRLDLKSNIQKFNEDSVRRNIGEYFKNFKWPNPIKSFGWYDSIMNGFINSVIEVLKPKELAFEDQLSKICQSNFGKNHAEINGQKKDKLIKLFTSFVASTVFEVSNTVQADSWIKNKRLEQIQKTGHLSQRAKEVKMLDFAASLIDDILIPPAKTAEEHMKFVNRAWDVTKKCWDANPQLGEIIRILYDLNERRALHPEEAEQIKNDFNLDAIIRSSYHKVTHRSTPDAKWISNPNKNIEQGIENIKISNGLVRKYRTIISPNRDNGYTGNKCVWNLVDCLEHEFGRRIYTGSIGISSNYDIVIKMKLDEPIPVDEFLECAKKTQNIDESYVDIINRHASKQPTNYVTPQGALATLEETRANIEKGKVR